MDHEAEKIYKSFLEKKAEVNKRKTARLKTFMDGECDCGRLQEENDKDEQSLSEAAQLTDAALYSLLNKSK